MLHVIEIGTSAFSAISLAFSICSLGVPFLATSFKEDVAYRFLYMKFADGKTPVKWIVELDPRGRDALQYRCKHVNFCENSDVPGDEEFLFAPFLQRLHRDFTHSPASAHR